MTRPDPEGVAVTRAFILWSLVGLVFWIAVAGGVWAAFGEAFPCVR
jgi:hypothetical protein